MATVKKEMAQGFDSGSFWAVLYDLVDDLRDIRDLLNEIRGLVGGHAHGGDDLVGDLESLRDLVNDLKSEMSQHTHGGVEEGSGTSGAAPEITTSDVTLTLGTGDPVVEEAGEAITEDEVSLRTMR